ncbi:MAG: multicopper oxidase domain-containing protein [Thermodesulfobacteriota bacterium]
MKNKATKIFPKRVRLVCLLALALTLGWQTAASGFTLNVVDHAGAPIANGFRWLLEEDNTNMPVIPTPGEAVTATKSVSLDIHKSYAPVAASGISATDNTVITPPDLNGLYILSVLPSTGYSVGGATISGNPTTVTVVVHSLPIPTSQISILIFQDHAPINNVPDDGEIGLAGASVTLHDAAGQLMQDGFGNPLGTEYNTGAPCDTDFDPDPASPTTCVTLLGNGSVITPASGEVVIKNLTPGKYGVVVTPPAAAAPGQWVQTSTIEGTRTVDAWVKADEPELYVEGFGTGFYHAFIGFVNPDALPGFAVGGTGKITGNLRYNHFDRPPANQGFHIGPPVKDCWVGVNDPVSGQGLYAAPCFDGIVGGDPNVEIPSSFSIPAVPPGTYQLVSWDKPIDALFGFKTVTMPATGDLNLGTVLAFRWFGSLLGNVYLDDNENGIRDAGEAGLAEQNINIRFRDGTIYQAQATDIFGGYALEEVFPFFKWLVVEVDFARFKATGMTAAVDHGGAIPGGFDENNPWGPLPFLPTFDQLNPQPQAADNPNTGNNFSRTETGEVLTQAMHLFLNQTNVIDWGKQTYTGTENGGVSGVVMYAVTRAENDPRFAAGEEWEPGIPRVQMNLYMDSNGDSIIDDLNSDGGPTLADVDNYPFANFPGAEDVDRNGNSVFDPGDAVSITTTDSWNDNPPSGCVQTLPIVHGQPIPECADSFGTWNQVRPGVFDGGYAFNSYYPGGIASGSNEINGLPSGQIFIVEATTPPGYLLLKEEDKNVDFGDLLQPSTQLLAPVCVGDGHLVPTLLSFQTDDDGAPLDGLVFEDLIPSPFGGETRPLCDRKQIGLNAQENAAADFFFFTKVPKAARAVGFVNNDLSAEFNQGSPNFGEKAAPAWIPVSFRDWKGNELTRVYTDEFGGYNAMLPSTYSVNVPSPTGVAPNMITLVLNDPYLPDGSLDPNHSPDYSVTAWTFQYEAGRTSYLDTPIVPVASFVNFPAGNLDAEPADGTPVITEVAGTEAAFGPLVCTDREPTLSNDLGTLTITSASPTTTVTNPEYVDSEPLSQATITRDYSFGPTMGQVLLDGVDITAGGTPLGAIDSWTDESITVTLDTLSAATGVLTVVRPDNGLVSESGFTLTITPCDSAVPGEVVHFVSNGGVYPNTPIQDAIDDPGTNPGDLILVGAGSYDENVIMHKPVRLQGAGVGVTSIQANPTPAERLTAWHDKVRTLLGTPGIDPFTANEAPGIMVLDTPASDFTATPSLIDGLTVSGSIAGSGIYVYRDIHNLVISNNEIFNNQGIFAGGIVIGTPDTGVGANNVGLEIRGNRIAKNGGIQGAGGLAIYSGADGYLVEDNLIIGNFSRFSGAGIAHVGLSDGGVIKNNRILFNEVFYGLLLTGAGDGGGIYLAGEVIGSDGDGAGSVTVEGNLIQGNLAGSGDGGGLRTFAFNASDVIDNPGVPANWHSLTITNNIIANNVAGQSGGGIFLQDTANATIVNNTIVNNDSTATSALSFDVGLSSSTPRPAGLVVTAHSPELALASTEAFPHPLLQNNIIWHNRSFYSDATRKVNQGDVVFHDYWDLAVVNTTTASDQMDISYSVLSSLSGPNGEVYSDALDNNRTDDPAFVHYVTNELFSAAVIDEGGNAISVRFTPLFENSVDYHLTDCSPLVDAGVDNADTPIVDFDGDARPDVTVSDIGADEYIATQTVYPALTLLSPVGGEIIVSGSEYNISWGAPTGAGIDSFELYYSLDGGTTWTLIDTVADPTAGCYLWQIEEEIQANDQVLVRVVALDDTAAVVDTVTSASGVTIDINALISPNGGETLIYDAASPTDTYQISWLNPYATELTDEISLWYQVNNGLWTLIATGLAGDATSYDWTIPPVTAQMDEYRIRLIIADSTFVNRLVDISDNPFFIQPAPVIAPVVPPVGPADDPVVGAEPPVPDITGAGINFQCPDATGGLASLSVVVDDGMYRADDGEITNPAKPQQVCLHLAAGDGFAMMADGVGQYMFGFSNVTGIADEAVMNMWDDLTAPGGVLASNFPSPLLKFKEGDEVYLTLTNVGMMMRPDLFDPHTVHWHGFRNAASIFDGVPEASISINMGSSLTYYYKAAEPGTFMYHCHVEASEHMQMGMLGNLYVTPAQDGTAINGFSQFAYNDGDGSTGYDHEVYLQLASFDPDFHNASENTQPLPFAEMEDRYPMINGRGYPDTINPGNISNAEGYESQRDHSIITAPVTAGQKILLRVSSLSTTAFHTLTVLGIPMQIVGQGSRQLGVDQYRQVNSVTLGGGQAFDVLLDTTGVAPGTYFVYVTNLDNLANHGEDFGGMMTEIVIQ